MAICPEGQVYNDQTCIWSGGKLLKPDLGYICHVFCVSGRIYDTYHKSVGCQIGTLGEFFLFTKIQDGRQPLYSKKLTIHF